MNSSISHLRRRIYRQVESSNNDLDEEDASKQGRTSDKTKPMFKDSDFDDLNDAGEGVSTATPRTPPTITTFFDDEDVTMAMAQTLIKMKEEKAKEKGVDIKDVEDSSRPIRSITTLQPLPTINPKDKAEMFDEVQARIDVDYELAAKMTQDEQEKYTIEERARLLVEFFERRKKQLAVERNMGGYKHSQLKGKSYEEIHGLYEKQQKMIQDFTPINSEKEAQKPSKRLKRVAGSYEIQKSPKKPKVMKSAKDVTEEEAAEDENEKEELRLSLKIISNDDSKVNYDPLSRKFPILNWEYQLLGKMEAKYMYVYKLTRDDGSSSYHRDTQAFLRSLDRQD
ncbi:hypothetical protein Tco_0443160, partial [Tanacetum coccineum]